jgi:type II secretion system protein H
MMRTQLNRQVPPSGSCACVRAKLPRRKSNGFTIMELMVVLLIMGIVAAVATPSFYASLRYHEIETAARRVALDLKQAQHAARVKSVPQSLTFTNATTYALSSGGSLQGSGQAYAVDLSKTPYELDSVTLNLGGATSVVFDGYGNASVGGTMVLQIGDKTRTITLNQSNGEITVDP